MEAFERLNITPPTVDAGYFGDIAALLLERSVMVVAGQRYRMREIEFYYNGGEHPDPFAHRDPLQKSSSRWYFHRDGGQYRGGSFKGLDISFGPTNHFCGILLCSISGPDGVFINGSSLCVDHILGWTGCDNVAALDSHIDGRPVHDRTSPLHLAPATGLPSLESWQTARVGLSLKRVRDFPEMPAYIMRRYRYFNAAREVKKGRLHFIIALHQDGRSPGEIRDLTGSPTKSIAKYIDEYETGLQEEDFAPFFRKALKNDDLCRLHGTWWHHYGHSQRQA